jgi:hypothetical protein
LIIPLYCSPTTGRGGPRGSGQVKVTDFLDIRHYEGGRSSALRTCRLYSRINPRYSFLEAELTQGHMVILVATENLPIDTTCINRVNFRAAHGRTHTEPNLEVGASCPVEPPPVWLVWNMVTERSGKWKLSDSHEPKNTWGVQARQIRFISWISKFLRQRIIPVIVCWFAGRTWKNNLKLYT